MLSSKSEHDHSLLLSLLVLHYSMIFASLFVCPDRRVLKLPRLLPGWWRSVPLELPGESSRKRSCDDTQGMPGELGILLGRFGESKAVQLRVDLNRLHEAIIPSLVDAATAAPRQATSLAPKTDGENEPS